MPAVLEDEFLVKVVTVFTVREAVGAKVLRVEVVQVHLPVPLPAASEDLWR